MKNIFTFIFGFFFCATSLKGYAQESFKLNQYLHDKYGIDYQVRSSVLQQYGSGKGDRGALRVKDEFYLGADVINSDRFGKGTVQFLYQDVNYRHSSAGDLQTQMGLGIDFNGDSTKREYLRRLVYTHTLGRNWDWLSLSVGQFQVGSFSKISYKDRPSHGFINNAMMGNSTRSYPSAGIGGYATVQVNKNFKVIAGVQDHSNYNPQNIRLKYLEDNRTGPFIYTQYKKNYENGAQTTYTFWGAKSPSIRRYPGQFNKKYDEKSYSWMMQVRHKWKVYTLYMQATGASRPRSDARQSYNLTWMMDDPLDISFKNQVGIGYALSKIPYDSDRIHKWENVAEAYWKVDINSFVSFTPDVQIYWNPAYSNRNIDVVLGLQLQLIF